jgi:predicted dehydrogenase
VAQDLRRILDDATIDAVSIATPNHWHALAAIWAMQAGKDVYVEKPVSHNVREGRIMVEAARRTRRICQAGTQIRSMAGSQAAIRFVREGKIGRVLVARGLCYKPRGSIGTGSPGSVPFGVNYNLWLGPAPHFPYQENRFHYNWHWLWATGNGDLGNQGIHQMDVARWGLGKTTLPLSVVGLGGRFGYADDGETPNTHIAVLDYGDSQILFETRGLKTDALKDVRIGNIFHGTEGTVVLINYSGGAAFDLQGNRVTTFEGGGDHFRNFIDCVKRRKAEELASEITEGHLSSALCHLGNISYRLGEAAPFGSPPTDLAGNEAALETFARFEQHLAENGVDTLGARYRQGRKLTLDVKAETFGRDPEAHALLFPAPGLCYNLESDL